MFIVPTAIHLHSRSLQAWLDSVRKYGSHGFPAGSQRISARRIEQFLYKKARRSFHRFISHRERRSSTGLFRFKPSSGAGASFSHPSVLMHLPPFHGHADATVSTI
jgi:hypothetical protein